MSVVLRSENTSVDWRDAEIERLKDELEIAKDRLAVFLGQETWPNLGEVSAPTHIKILKLLYTRRVASRKQIYEALYGDRHCDAEMPQGKIIDVQVCKMRPLLPEGSIATLWGRGYELTDIGKAWVKAKLEAAGVAA